MKKLVSLALAGICALAFAAAADAGTAVRMKAPLRQQGTTKTTGYGNVNINYVQTRFNITKNGKLNNYDYSRGVYINGDVKGYTVDDNPDATSMGEYLNCGGKYEVRSLFTNDLLSSQRVYDDLREALASEYARMIPAVAGEISSIHTAVETYGNGRVYSGEKVVANAGSEYSSTYNIAYQVIPGRIATLANGDGQIEESSVQGKRTNNNNTVAGDNAARAAAANNRTANAQATTVTDNDGAFVQAVKNSFANAIFTTSVATDFKNQLKEAYNQDLAAFNAQETANYNATVAEKARLQAELDQFIADYNAAVSARNTALTALNQAKANTEAKQTAYNSAVSARVTAETNLANARTAEANAKTALTNAKADKTAKESAYNSAKNERVAAETALTNAKTAEANAKTALDNAKADEATAQVAFNNADKQLANFDYGMREEALSDTLDTAREALSDAQSEYDEALEAKNEAEGAYELAQEPITKVEVGEDGEEVEVQVVDEEAVNSAFAEYQTAKLVLHEKTINLSTAESSYLAAQEAYNDGIIALNAEQQGLVNAKNDAKNVLDNANAEVISAQENYDAKVSAREAKEDELQVAKDEEAEAKTALDNAKENKRFRQIILAHTKLQPNTTQCNLYIYRINIPKFRNH